MILIFGPSGSGKTALAKEMERCGYFVIPTYTTRPIRENDFFTEHISESEMNRLINEKQTISDVTYDTEYGRVSYCIKNDDCGKYNSVLIANMKFYEDICKVDPDLISYKVFLDVDYNTIINNKVNRGITDIDTKKRLERDAKDMEVLKSESNLVIQNHGFKMSPSQLVSEIVSKIIDYYFKDLE